MRSKVSGEFAILYSHKIVLPDLPILSCTDFPNDILYINFYQPCSLAKPVDNVLVSVRPSVRPSVRSQICGKVES